MEIDKPEHDSINQELPGWMHFSRNYDFIIKCAKCKEIIDHFDNKTVKNAILGEFQDFRETGNLKKKHLLYIAGYLPREGQEEEAKTHCEGKRDMMYNWIKNKISASKFNDQNS